MLLLYANTFNREPPKGSYKDYYPSSRQQGALSVNKEHVGCHVNLEQPSDSSGGGSRPGLVVKWLRAVFLFEVGVPIHRMARTQVTVELTFLLIF